MSQVGRWTRSSIAAGVVLAAIGATFAYHAYDVRQPTRRGWDRARFSIRESLVPPRTDGLIGLEWTLVDLPPAGDVPATGAYQSRRSNAAARQPRRDLDEPVLHGGASSTFVTRVIARMEPGVTYSLSVEVAPQGIEEPDARIYLTRAPRTTGGARPPVVAEQRAGPWREQAAADLDFVWTDLRYTAAADDAELPLFAHLESAGGGPEAAVTWDSVQLFAYPPLDSHAVRDKRTEIIWDRSTDSIRAGVVLSVFFSPVAAQLFVLVLLVRTRHREVLPDGAWIRLLLVLGLAVAPIQELVAWGIISAEEWQGARGAGYWRYVWTSSRAIVWLPWGLAASLLIGAAAVVGPRWRRARLVGGVLAARAAATAMFVLPALVQSTDSMIFRFGLPLLFVVPVVATANDLLLARRLTARAGQEDSRVPWLRAWRWTWLATLAAQLVHAIGTHARLLPERPSGDCFVVTAAAQGHPRIVRSWVESDGRRANAQLETLRGLEDRLRARAPRCHRGLRAVYDLLGPIAAARLDRPWRADVAYLALKPLEWLARITRG